MSINRVLVVVDVQQEYFDGPLRIQYPTPEIVRDTVVTAIVAARAADVPVVLIEHENPASAVALLPDRSGRSFILGLKRFVIFRGSPRTRPVFSPRESSSSGSLNMTLPS